MPKNKAFNRLAELLADKGITTPTEDALDRMGIPSIKTWNKYINKVKDPTFQQVIEIAKWLNVPEQDLFTFDTSKQ